MAGILASFWLVGCGTLSPAEATLGTVAVLASLGRVLAPRWRPVTGGIVLAAALLDLTLLRGIRPQRLLATTDTLFADGPALAELQAKMTPQDRAYRLPGGGLFPKSASLFAIPSIDDYEPLTARRYAEFLMMLRTGRRLVSVRDFHWREVFPFRLNPRLLALTAARYLVVDPLGTTDPRTQEAIQALEPPPAAVPVGRPLLVYENQQALPRAFYVPRIEVVSDPEEILRRLAAGRDDPRATALVERPVSTFFGLPGGRGPGEVTFVENDPERLELAVNAPERGFLLLADQYAEGWDATVDDRPVPIARANYAFRLVEVPKGRSTVRFEYVPPYATVGSMISAATLAVLLGAWLHARRREG
jgi:hypothetical protein